jgi:hypothetical protein
MRFFGRVCRYTCASSNLLFHLWLRVWLSLDLSKFQLEHIWHLRGGCYLAQSGLSYELGQVPNWTTMGRGDGERDTTPVPVYDPRKYPAGGQASGQQSAGTYHHRRRQHHAAMDRRHKTNEVTTQLLCEEQIK